MVIHESTRARHRQFLGGKGDGIERERDREREARERSRGVDDSCIRCWAVDDDDDAGVVSGFTVDLS